LRSDYGHPPCGQLLHVIVNPMSGQPLHGRQSHDSSPASHVFLTHVVRTKPDSVSWQIWLPEQAKPPPGPPLHGGAASAWHGLWLVICHRPATQRAIASP
jgi:hypothetical protein